MTPDLRFQTSLKSLSGKAIIAALASGAMCIVAVVLTPARFFPCYLVSYWFWLSLTLGSLAIGMLHHLTGGGWGISIRRTVESAGSTCLLMAILFLPIAFGMSHLYVWSNADEAISGVHLREKSAYLNVHAFYVRAAVYFMIWTIWSFVLNTCTSTADPQRQRRRQPSLAIVSGWGLALWGLSITFASIDWVMSLEPQWYSSMYGVLYMGGSSVAAMSCAIIVGLWLRPMPGSINVLTTSRLHDLGNFLLAFVMFWSYVEFMQFLIVWEADLPEEIPWFLRRSRGGWQGVVGALMLLHFLLPFLLLLMRQVKRVGRPMLLVASLLLVMRLMDLCWLVLPPFTPSLATEWISLWPLLVTLPAIGGLWLAVFCRRLAARGVVPVHEFPDSEEAYHAVAGQVAE